MIGLNSREYFVECVHENGVTLGVFRIVVSRPLHGHKVRQLLDIAFPELELDGLPVFVLGNLIRQYRGEFGRKPWRVEFNLTAHGGEEVASHRQVQHFLDGYAADQTVGGDLGRHNT